MKKILKILGLIVLLLSMGHASNWDLPSGAQSNWEIEHQEELQAYEEARSTTYYVIIGDDIYEGAYVDGMWHEPSEIYQEVVDAYMGKAEYRIVEVKEGETLEEVLGRDN